MMYHTEESSGLGWLIGLAVRNTRQILSISSLCNLTLHVKTMDSVQNFGHGYDHIQFSKSF